MNPARCLQRGLALALGLAALNGWTCVAAFEPAPPPRPVASPVAVSALKSGYQVSLNRRTAELLRDAVEGADEKQLADAVASAARDVKSSDESTAATLQLIALVVRNQLPAFRKALRENIGPGGAVITVNGLQSPAVKFRKPRPRLERAVEAVRGAMPLLPDDAREAVAALSAVARTTPLFWKVEPR